MPAKLHRALEREAAKRGMSGKRKDAYVYGTMARQKAKQKGKKDGKKY